MYKLLVGLGNPNKRYQADRHNLGQVLVENFAKLQSIQLTDKEMFKAKIGRFKDTILAIPNTYMNLSGQSVQKIVQFYKISPKNIYIVHDDLDIGVGESKIQFDRGSAGHNGIKSVIDSLGTQAFWRLRIGIGRPQDNLTVEDYVLTPPTQQELPQINQVIDKLIKDLDKILGL